MDYQQFLESKQITQAPTGREVDDSEINPILFPFQRDLVRWSLRKVERALQKESDQVTIFDLLGEAAGHD